MVAADGFCVACMGRRPGSRSRDVQSAQSAAPPKNREETPCQIVQVEDNSCSMQGWVQ